MKLLVMGGTEFVSKAVAKYFISKEYQVDIFTRGVREVDYNGINIHHKGNRLDSKELEQISNIKYDFVIDITAYNLEDVKQLTRNLDLKNINKYVYCSSGAVYTPDNNMIKEDFKKGLNPNWKKYGLDKLEAEEYLLKLYNEEQLPVTIIRPTYIYGPGNNLYREGYFFDSIKNGNAIPYPDNENSTQFIHIDDLVKTIESLMLSDKSSGEAYNITNETVYTFKDIVEVFFNVTDKVVPTIPVKHKDFNISRRYFPFRDVTYTLSIDKLKEHNIYLPKYDLFEGLSNTYKWYNTNKPKLSDKAITQIKEIIEFYK